MQPNYRISTALLAMLRLRARTIVPLQIASRRLAIALARGKKRTKALAEFTWRSGDGPGAIALWRDLEQQEPLNDSWPLKIAQAAKERGDWEVAERTLQEARDRGIETERLELDLLRYARLTRRSNTALEDAEVIVADPKASAGKVFYAAYHLLTQNRLAGARQGFERLRGDPVYGHLAEGNLAATGLVEESLARGRPQVLGRASPAQNSIVVREPSSDTLVVGFALPEGTLGLPLNATHAMLSPAGVNALYLYDSLQLFHLAGTDRFGPGYQAMLDGIRAFASEIGARKLITVGGSGTGYTAIHAGIDLGADAAIAFSPGTLMLPTTNVGVARSAHTVRRLQKGVLSMMKNLRPYVKTRTTCPQIAIYYSASNRRDIMHASNLAGLPGVTLHAVPALERHDCLTEMAARGYRDLLLAFEKP